MPSEIFMLSTIVLASTTNTIATRWTKIFRHTTTSQISSISKLERSRSNSERLIPKQNLVSSSGHVVNSRPNSQPKNNVYLQHSSLHHSRSLNAIIRSASDTYHSSISSSSIQIDSPRKHSNNPISVTNIYIGDANYYSVNYFLLFSLSIVTLIL